ncbi:hypothetical protein ACFUJR_25850 [Streptomyces sp. NPDC057271]|uniref:hypothetical protein n=1 Tax=unclassified Streptomyces TaxID=2593676 RepID=UPI003638341C
MGPTTLLLAPSFRELNPGVGRAAVRNLVWMTERGLLLDDTDTDRFLAGRVTHLATGLFPAIPSAQLDLAADLVGWALLLADRLAGGGARRDRAWVQETVGQLTTVIDCPGAPRLRTHPPLVRAWVDVWERSCGDMPDVWRTRAGAHWKEAFKALQGAGRFPALCLPLLDLAEVFHGQVLRPDLYRTGFLTRLRSLTGEHLALVDEAFSGCVPVAAVQAGRSADRTLRDFRSLAAQAGAVCADMDLSAGSRMAVDLHIQAMRWTMRAHADWLRIADAAAHPME